MKRLVASLLVLVMVCSLTACGKSKAWTDKDFIMRNGYDEIEVKQEMVFTGFEDESSLVAYAACMDGDEDFKEIFYDGYATNRGLEIGMKMEDFRKLYDVKEGYAVWEVIFGDDIIWTEFAPYDAEQDINELYEEFSDEIWPNFWLDIGFCKDGDEWIAMEDVDVQDVWFCNADEDNFSKVAILSVCFNSGGEIVAISLSHIKYDGTWEKWQGWE